MNQRMTIDELIEKEKEYHMGGHWTTPAFFGGFMSYKGNQVVYSKYAPEIIIVKECQYCKTYHPRLDKYDCCVHCGGPVE